MTLLTLNRLVKTLSGPEKRNFKLYCGKQSGNKDYLDLFDIIDKTPLSNITEVQEKFKKKAPGSSLNNTAGYLIKVLTDCLVKSKTEKDNFFGIMQDIMRVKIFQERSLGEEGHALLKKIRRNASRSQQHLVEYLTYREELNHCADSNFLDLDDKELIETQMKAKEVLKSLNHIHDHHSLFELLKYRLVNTGKISSDEEKKRLNDLMLSEMILVGGKSKNSFAAQKLHLLFQSFFFTDIGDYQSALKVFHALSNLFEQNLKLLDNPPLDYLSALNGILDSLHTLQKFEELSYYIDKAMQLDKPEYPEYFRYQVKKTVAVYLMVLFTGKKDYAGAVSRVLEMEKDLIRMYPMVNEEKQWELYFYCSLAFFGMGEKKKAHRYLSDVMQFHKLQPQSMICKAIRLLNILIHYEQGDTHYLEYEARSYKRFFRKKHQLLKTENLLLKFIFMWPDESRRRIPLAEYNKIIKEIENIKEDKYENQLLKYFNFTGWLANRITK